MKTSELKKSIDESALEFANYGGCIEINQYVSAGKKVTMASVSSLCPLQFSIYRPKTLGKEIVNLIIEYSRTPIKEREEKYIKVDIPVADWEKINSGFIFGRDEVNEKQGNMTFFTNDGFDAMFSTLRLIQAKYEDEYQK